MKLYLQDFKQIRPNFEASQETLLDWIVKTHLQVKKREEGWKSGDPSLNDFADQLRENIFKIGLGKNKIQKRGFQLEDCTHEKWEEMQIYNLAHAKEGFHLDKRMAFYDRASSDIFEQFYPEDTPLPPHLIHVTCTGYVAPSPAQRIVSNKRSGKSTMVTHAYHMGCYGQIPAVRMGMGHFLTEGEKSDIVHTEFSSIHMNPSLHTIEQLVVQSLFADGFIKYSVNGENKDTGFQIHAIHEEVVGNSLSKMTWAPHYWGFQMSISRDIPVLIRRSLKEFLIHMLKKAGLSLQDIEKAHFAIHPGGPKIIEQTADALGLSTEQIRFSLGVMQDYGNMSSATLPHVWERILNDPSVKKGELVISMAFGPGLNISGALLEKV